MQTQYPQQGTMPLQHGMVHATPNGYRSQAYANPPPPQTEMPGPFAHLSHLPVFEIYSLKEFGILWNTMQQRLKNLQENQQARNDLPPPPTTADAMTAKLVSQYLSVLTDGGMTLVASQFNINKVLSGTLNMLDAMEKYSMEQATKPNATVVYSRWASPRETNGPPIIVDVLAWYSINKRSHMTGVQVKANTTSKIKINAEKPFTVKDGKEWKKTWFRGRQDFLDIDVIGGDGASLRLGKVMAVERDLLPDLVVDFYGRWKEYSVPRLTASR